MKNAIIFHGTDCQPDSDFYCYTWLKNATETDWFSCHPHSYNEVRRVDARHGSAKLIFMRQFYMSVEDKIKRLMESQDLCTISTIGDDTQPESAIVGFSSDDRFEITIGTSNKSRKFANIERNQKVAIVVYANGEEIQYEGVSRVLTPGELPEELRNHFNKLPDTERYLEDSEQRWLRVSPNWIRYSIHHGGPDNSEEIEFSGAPNASIKSKKNIRSVQ